MSVAIATTSGKRRRKASASPAPIPATGAATAPAATGAATAKTPQVSPTLARVHETHEATSAVELEPPHPPRKETPLYRATHRRLIITEDRPCYVCGVRRSDLLSKARRNDPRINPYKARVMESHHFPVERGLLAAVDRELLAQAYPTVRQYKTLEAWVDSEYNMLVLCSSCHRLADHAIHRALWQDVIATKFALRDTSGHRFEFAATPTDAAQVEAADEALVEEVRDDVTPGVLPSPPPAVTVATPPGIPGVVSHG